MRTRWIAMMAIALAGCLPSYERGNGNGGTGGAGNAGNGAAGNAGGGGSGNAGSGGSGAGGAAAPACAPFAATPSCGAGLKCDIADVTPATMSCLDSSSARCDYVFGCVPAGAKRHGEPCTTRTSADFFFEVDDCMPGTTCVAFADAPVYTCQRLCTDVTQCAEIGPSSRCMNPYARPSNLQVCTMPCSLGDARCPEGYDCHPISPDSGDGTEWQCVITGTAAIGASCENLDCVSGADCLYSEVTNGYVCRKLCDATHGCPAPATCQARPGLRNQGGFCL